MNICELALFCTIHFRNVYNSIFRLYLQAGGDAVLTDAGVVTAEEAKAFAETEFEKYRIIQDRLFQSDFDRFAENDILPLDFKEIESEQNDCQ